MQTQFCSWSCSLCLGMHCTTLAVTALCCSVALSLKICKWVTFTVWDPVRLLPALLFLKNVRAGGEWGAGCLCVCWRLVGLYCCRTKAYLVLILSFKSYQTCLRKGRLETNLCLSRATALCAPRKQWNVCDCCRLPLDWLFIHFMIKSKFDLSWWSTATVKGHWQNPRWLKWDKGFQVFSSKPFHGHVAACLRELFLYLCLLDSSSIFKSHALSCAYFNSVTVPFNPCGIWSLWERSGVLPKKYVG